VLLELALARGRFLELLGGRDGDKARCDELFLVGLLSLLDSLLGIAMDRVVERLHLSVEIRQVLLHGSGPFGFHLALAVSVEKNRTESVLRLAQRLGIPLEDLERASADAMAWAGSAVTLGA
jgi:EAL and modified HD-GYP domain-containing signal transduction protein